MRNWLRRWLGVGEKDTRIETLTDTFTLLANRLDSIESIDLEGKVGAGSVVVSPLESTIHTLSAESLGHTTADNDIRKRLLAVEGIDGGHVSNDPPATELAQAMELVFNQLEKLASLDAKHTAHTKLMDQLLANVNEYRKEVQAVKQSQNSVVEFTRDTESALAETLANNLNLDTDADRYEKIKELVGPMTPAERKATIAFLGVKSAPRKLTKKKSPAKPKKAR